MTRRIVWIQEAEREFDDAADWYQEKGSLGAEFVASVRDALHRVSEDPELHAVVHRDVRCARVRRFPYNIFFRIHVDRIEVIAVVHGHRDPSVWKRRV